MDFTTCIINPMDEIAASIISEWEYPAPYDVYSFKSRPNGYLLDKNVWGKELFYLACNNAIIGYVACQYDDADLWVGWALAPELCGKGNGDLFISNCIQEIRRVKLYYGILYLRVAAWNIRAIKAYEKAGFVYVDTIIDEIAYSNKPEDFWIMQHSV